MTSAPDVSATDVHAEPVTERLVLVVGGEGGGHALAGRLKRAHRVLWCAADTLTQQVGAAPASVDLIGIGPGGTRAIAYAAAHPAGVRRLAVVSAPWPEDVAGSPAPKGLSTVERSLVIWGAADHRVRPREGERVVSALGRSADPATVEMVTLPGVGHQVLDVAGERVAAILDDFLR